MFGTVGVIFCTLGVIFELIFGPWRHLGVTFGALWMHFSCQKNRLGRQRCPKRRHPRYPLTFLDPFLELTG